MEESKSDSKKDLPWPVYNEYFSFVEEEGKNIKVQCKLCPVGKTISCGKTSATNLKKHLASKHPNVLPKIQQLLLNGGNKRKAIFEEPSGAKLKQPRIDQNNYSAPCQATIDKLIMNYVIKGLRPFSICDGDNEAGAAFRELMQGVLPKARIMCSKTLKERLTTVWKKTEDNIKNKFTKINYVATTADCWSTAKRGFLGVTAHWIDPHTLERQQAAIACKRLKGRHTYDVIAESLFAIYQDYRILNKTTGTTTDSGSNFIKAFRVFGRKPENDEKGADGNLPASRTKTVEDDDLEFVEICDILSMENDLRTYPLPEHYRCAAHTLNLVATKDAEAVTDVLYKKIMRSTFAKCQSLWNKQNMSTVASDTIKEILGVYLSTPCITRWNSTFDAFVQIKKILALETSEGAREGTDKMNSCMDALGLPLLQPNEVIFIKEYVMVMKSVSAAIDVLQSEKAMFLGYLLPVLYKIKRELEEIVQKNQLQFCVPLAKCLLAGISKRFESIWNSPKLLIAPCVHPKFKLYWLPNEKHAEIREMVLDQLRTRQEEIVDNQEVRTPDAYTKSDDPVDCYFNYTHPSQNSKNSLEDVLDAFWKEKDTSLSLLKDKRYSLIKEMFLQFNTVLPTSASVERLFSTANLTLTDKRHALTDENFEMQLLLKFNKPLIIF